MGECTVELTAAFWVAIALSALIPALAVSLVCWVVVRRG